MLYNYDWGWVAVQGERVSGAIEWIERCLSKAREQAAEADRPMPEQVTTVFRSLLAGDFQRPLKGDELRKSVVEIATANSADDARRKD